MAADKSFQSLSKVPVYIKYTITTFSINHALDVIANTKHASITDHPIITRNGIANVATYPSLTSGTNYTAPFMISKTSIVNAIAFGINSTNQLITSNLITHTYVFIADVMQQDTMGGSAELLNSLGNKTFYESFLQIPSLCLSSSGVYPIEDWRQVDNVTQDAPRPLGYIEWLDHKRPDDHWRMDCEYSRKGGYTRRLKKKSLKIVFRNGNLDFDLFNVRDKEDYYQKNYVRPTKKINKVILRVSSDNVFYSYLQPVLYYRGIWNDLLMQDLGLILVHSRLVHLYFNTQYQGMITMREIMDEHWHAEYCGGNRSQYEIIDQEYAGDQNPKPTPFFSTMALAANKKWSFLKPYLDWNSFFAFHIALHFGAHTDVSDQHNYQGGGRDSNLFPYDQSTNPSCGWRFFLHDNDNMFYYSWNVNHFEPDMLLNYKSALKGFFYALTNEAHPDFIVRLQDYAHKMYYRKDSPFTEENSVKFIQHINNSLHMVDNFYPETARWGYNVPKEWCWSSTSCAFPNGFYARDYLNGINNVINNYFPQRGTFMKQLYERKGWANSIYAPTFNVEDGAIVPEGTAVTIDGVGTNSIVYTTNGQDPRMDEGGQVNPTARVVARPASIVLTDTTKFKARQRTAGGVWGALEEIIVNVKKTAGCVLCGNIIITELNYHHKVLDIPGELKDKTPDASFMEFKNIGNTPIVMTGATIDSKSIRYTFPILTLGPNEFWVVAHYVHDFRLVYGVLPNGTYSGDFNHKKGFHSLKLVDSTGIVAQDFTYSINLPWPKVPDGFGYSLVAVVNDYQKIVRKNPDTTAKHFRHSTNINGSPWKDDPEPVPVDLGVKFHFIDYNDNELEIRNPTNKNIDLSDWALRDSFNSEDGYDFPAGTIIKPNEIIKVTKQKKMKFSRDKSIVLFRAVQMNGENVHTGHYIEFDASENMLAIP